MAKGLGKGINALFNNVDSNEETVEEIKLKDLRPNPYQPRKTFDDDALSDLKESIQQHVFYSRSLFVNRLKDMT